MVLEAARPAALDLGRVEVIPVAGDPSALIIAGQQIAVASIHNRWRIDDLRYARARTAIYFAARLETGDLVTLSHDRTDDTWEIRRVG